MTYIDSKLFYIISYHKHLYHDIYSYRLYRTSLQYIDIIHRTVCYIYAQYLYWLSPPHTEGATMASQFTWYLCLCRLLGILYYNIVNYYNIVLVDSFNES